MAGERGTLVSSSVNVLDEENIHTEENGKRDYIHCNEVKHHSIYKLVIAILHQTCLLFYP